MFARARKIEEEEERRRRKKKKFKRGVWTQSAVLYCCDEFMDVCMYVCMYLILGDGSGFVV